MGRFRQTSDEGEETSIDMSPLIDCVFILLIFFIVTTTFVEESGIEVDKPNASPPTQQEEDKTTIVFALQANGDIVYEGRKLPFSGIQPVVRNILQAEDAPVIVQASDDSHAGRLVQIIDEAKRAGATKVSIAKGRN